MSRRQRIERVYEGANSTGNKKGELVMKRLRREFKEAPKYS